MLFNSWGYLVFLLVFVTLHWALPHGRARMGLLVFASLVFYGMWRWDFCGLMMLSAGVDYVAAKRIHASDRDRVRRFWLVSALSINLGLLVFFKYSYFLYDNVRAIGGLFGTELQSLQDMGLNIVLPLGISFYTFQTICYTIDVYRRLAQPIPSFLTFTAFVTYWPQLIAGPVLRVQEVVPQLEARRRPERDALALGLQMIVVGLFKKAVLADSLAPMVDEAFARDPASMGALDAWVASFLFGFQIYFDFAGYSTIALGSAVLMGVRLPANFNWPYVSKSPREFWQRWHISLSSWIRDYLYLPLAGLEVRSKSTGGLSVATEGRRTRALLLTWLIMGLWHGARWNFALWGLYHAAIILAYRALPFLRELPKRAPVLALPLMLLFGMAGWIAFRATSLGHALTLYGRILNPLAYRLDHRALDIYAYLWAALVTAGMFVAYAVQARHRRRPFAWPAVWVASAASLAVMVCAILICLSQKQQFLYFQF